MDENGISITLDNGQELECKILFTFEHGGEVYVAFTEAEETEENSVFVAKVEAQSDGSGKLSEVEDDEVYDIAGQLLEEYQSGEHCDCDCDCEDGECDCHHHHGEGECNGECSCHHEDGHECKKNKN